MAKNFLQSTLLPQFPFHLPTNPSFPSIQSSLAFNPLRKAVSPTLKTCNHQTVVKAKKKKKNEEVKIDEEVEIDEDVKIAQAMVEEVISVAKLIVATVKEIIPSNIQKGSRFESKKTWVGFSFYAMEKLFEEKYEVVRDGSPTKDVVFYYKTFKGVSCKLELHHKGFSLYILEPLFSINYYTILSEVDKETNGIEEEDKEIDKEEKGIEEEEKGIDKEEKGIESEEKEEKRKKI